jgi:peptide/nickel transport system substrate-binding protein
MRGQSVPGTQNAPPFVKGYADGFTVDLHCSNDRYINAEVNAMIKSLLTETDLANRDATMAEIWKNVQEDRVFLMVHNQILAHAAKENVQVAVHPENQPSMTEVTFK